MADKPTDPTPKAAQPDVNAEKARAIFAERYGADKAKNAEVVQKQSGKTEILYWINGVPIKVKKG